MILFLILWGATGELAVGLSSLKVAYGWELVFALASVLVILDYR